MLDLRVPQTDIWYQELMSGEAAKERVTSTYVRVPSKSSYASNELPYMETASSIVRHSDDVELHV